LLGEGFGGRSFTGNPGSYVKKVSGCGPLSLHGGPFPPEGDLICGRGLIPGTLISFWSSVRGGLLFGDPEGHEDEASLSMKNP